MGLRRFTILAALAAVLLLGLPMSATAGNFDEQAMGCTGENPATCATGTTGQPYTLIVRLQGDEDTGCAVVSVSSGQLPPGLSITQQFNETKHAVISGTPTQAGKFEFYLTVTYNAAPSCNKPASDDRFIIPINEGLPKLTIGPESTTPGTVGTPYSLQMTATVEGAKTWSINSGALPTGLALDPATGLISGTPSAAGSYTFEVLAKMAADTRQDTKVLGIVVRDALAIQSAEPLATAPAPTAWEVSVPFTGTLTATGGSGTYAFSLAAGSLPTGLTLGEDGTLTGTPSAAGVFRATIRLADTEGRTLDYPTSFRIAERLAVSTLVLRPGKVGKRYLARLRTTGGVAPTTWEITRGQLPRGIKFGRKLGILIGVPKQSGRFRLRFEATDHLDVVATRTLRLVIQAKPQPKRKPKAPVT